MASNHSKPKHEFHSPLSLHQNFLWTLLGNIVYGGCQWGFLIAIAKLGSPEMVGQFALALAIVVPISLFFKLELRVLQATDTNQGFTFADYLVLRLLSTILFFIAVITAILLFRYNLATAQTILLVAVVKGLEAVSDVYYGLLQRYERMDRISKSLILRSLLSLIVLITLLKATGNLNFALLGLALIGLVILTTYDVYGNRLPKGDSPTRQIRPSRIDQRKKQLLGSFSFSKLMLLVRLSLPVSLMTTLLSLNVNIPRYFIEHSLGQKELGVFSAIAYLPTAGYILVLAMGQSVLPRIAKSYAAGENTVLRSLVYKLVGLGILLGGTGILGAILGGQQILSLLYEPEYANYKDVFVLLMLWGAILYTSSLLNYCISGARKFSQQLLLISVVVPINVALCSLLSPSYGLKGATLALVFSEALYMTGAFFLTYQVFQSCSRLAAVSKHTSADTSF